jgi:hypothetical protein
MKGIWIRGRAMHLGGSLLSSKSQARRRHGATAFA